MIDTFYELRAEPLREARASCGCSFVLAARRAIDAREGRWLTSWALVVVPCALDEHVEVGREVAGQFVGEIADSGTLVCIAAEMDARTR